TVNFGTEPVSANSVAVRCFGIDFINTTEKPPVRYDMRTKYAALFDATGDYLYSAEETFERINCFLAMRQALVQA
ncbi:MAG TPA: pyridine nucleotide transhydrogenase, partial [Blastocatellia bacterium]|nr:pyridine nucleotide transhydrogenase [Blastocatellia bacterium]